MPLFPPDVARMLRGRKLAFLDFEASSLDLAVSYPLSVGIAFLDRPEPYHAYIRPHDEWTDWSWQSEEVHRMSRRFLMDVGRQVVEVAHEVRQAIGPEAGYFLFSDNPTFENHWLETLLSYGDQPYDFACRHVRPLVEYLAVAQNRDLSAAYDAAAARRPKTHRADEDALFLRELVLELLPTNPASPA